MQMLSFLLLIFTNVSIIFASHASVPVTDTDEEVRTDQKLTELAYSNQAYDNVGKLYFRTPSQWVAYGSAVFFEGKTCFTTACCVSRPNSAVCFETNHKKTYYDVMGSLPLVSSDEKYSYNFCLLILDRPVIGLQNLKINYEFPLRNAYEDNQHLLTYVGYGTEISENSWFCSLDGPRKAMKAYTQKCSFKVHNNKMYSTPYGQYNLSKENRPLGEFESCLYDEMDGGGVFDSNNELVSIISSSHFPLCVPISTLLYRPFSCSLNFIHANFCRLRCTELYLNTHNLVRGTRACSIPLKPLKNAIERVRQQYDSTTPPLVYAQAEIIR